MNIFIRIEVEHSFPLWVSKPLQTHQYLIIGFLFFHWSACFWNACEASFEQKIVFNLLCTQKQSPKQTFGRGNYLDL